MKTSRYPLSTSNGQQIRTDILRTSGTFRYSFVTTGRAAESLPVDTEIVRVWATQDCWFLNADAVALAPVNATPSLIVNSITFIPKLVWTLIAIDPTVLKYSVVRDTTDGDILVSVIEKWNLLALDVQTRNT